MDKFALIKSIPTFSIMKKLRLSGRLILLALLIYQTGNAQEDKKSYKVTCVGFYNLENLFDYSDDTLINDEEYLPDGGKAWDSTKYTSKLYNMSRVVSEIGTKWTPDGAAVLGVCEVENRGVLEDLVAMPKLKDRNYQIVRLIAAELMWLCYIRKNTSSTSTPINIRLR